MTRTGSVRQTPNQRPVISVVCAVMVVPYRLIRVSTQVLFLVAWLAMSVGVPIRSPRSRGRPRFPLAAGVGWWNTALLRARVVMLMWCPRPAPVNIPHTVRSTGRRMKPVNIAVNTSYPGAVKQERKRRSSDDRESGTLTLAGIGGTLQFVGGVVSTTNVPPHSVKCSAGAPTEWHSIYDIKVPFVR